ncbi:hypothetical protein [Fodinisporobacter ferrooxydans]
MNGVLSNYSPWGIAFLIIFVLFFLTVLFVALVALAGACPNY